MVQPWSTALCQSEPQTVYGPRKPKIVHVYLFSDDFKMKLQHLRVHVHTVYEPQGTATIKQIVSSTLGQCQTRETIPLKSTFAAFNVVLFIADLR